MLDPTIGGKDSKGAERSEAERESVADRKEAVDPQAWSSDRAQLVSLEQKSQEAYDKAVLILSGGALGLSLVVLKDSKATRWGWM